MKNDNQILINKKLADKHGIQLDEHGFPTEESLQAYHTRHNPKTQHGQRTIRLTNQPTAKPN